MLPMDSTDFPFRFPLSAHSPFPLFGKGERAAEINLAYERRASAKNRILIADEHLSDRLTNETDARVKGRTDSINLSISFYLKRHLILDSCVNLDKNIVERAVYTLVALAMDGLQPIPRDSNENGVAAMLDDTKQIKEAGKQSFVNVIQYGGDDVT